MPGAGAGTHSHLRSTDARALTYARTAQPRHPYCRWPGPAPSVFGAAAPGGTDTHIDNDMT